MNVKKFGVFTPLVCLVINLLLVYVAYQLVRLAYLFENWGYFSESLTGSHVLELFGGSLVFDTSAILYTNALYILLMLLPVPQKETPAFHRFLKGLFLTVNGVALAVNLCDAVYFPFTMRRTTNTVFHEFSNEGNIGSILLTETLRHWYLVVFFIVLMVVLWWCYCRPVTDGRHRPWWRYSLVQTLSLALAVPLCVAGMRGGFTTAVRPITISNANQYVDRPVEAALILNTPFSLIRTIGKTVFTVPTYYATEQEMETVYSPIHVPSDTTVMTKKNVVVLIVESFGREYIGALNKDLEHGRYRGYTPCVDSLIARSTTFRYSYCNGRKSIDGMPSILSSIPMFVEPFFLTPASMNQVGGIASLLAGEGYQTAFFHGAQRGSMGFMAFARSTGFQQYYGREDYEDDRDLGGSGDDFDGMWAIWDEPFLQYYAKKMSQMQQPFMTAVFTASSHHPYAIPDKYKDVYPEEGLVIHKCIRYTDMSIGRFFETASRQPWFKNTIFVLTSDHTNISDHAYYQTDLGGYCSPIIIYDPGNPVGQVQDKIAQQIDILPTLMGMLGYQKPYFAFGIDVLNAASEDTWAVNYLNGVYQYVKHGHVLQFDGNRTTAVYSLEDSLMQHNLLKNAQLPTPNSQLPEMERELKAIIQQYMVRMTQDRLQP